MEEKNMDEFDGRTKEQLEIQLLQLQVENLQMKNVLLHFELEELLGDGECSECGGSCSEENEGGTYPNLN